MRVIKFEEIYLSQNEHDTWMKFSQILEGLEQESDDPIVLESISEITGHMSDLWERIVNIE